jgi:hypothetical protein
MVPTIKAYTSDRAATWTGAKSWLFLLTVIFHTKVLFSNSFSFWHIQTFSYLRSRKERNRNRLACQLQITFPYKQGRKTECDSVRTRTCNVLLHTREQCRRGDSRMQSAISNAWPSLTEHCSQHKRPKHSKHLVVVRLLQAISSLAASQRQGHAIHLQMRQFVRFLLY